MTPAAKPGYHIDSAMLSSDLDTPGTAALRLLPVTDEVARLTMSSMSDSESSQGSSLASGCAIEIGLVPSAAAAESRQGAAPRPSYLLNEDEYAFAVIVKAEVSAEQAHALADQQAAMRQARRASMALAHFGDGSQRHRGLPSVIEDSASESDSDSMSASSDEFGPGARSVRTQSTAAHKVKPLAPAKHHANQTSPELHQCEHIISVLREAGLHAKRVRSLNRRRWLIKVRAPEWRLRAEAERINLRLRARDGNWRLFRRADASLFIPAGPSLDLAEPDQVSIFHSSDQQLLLYSILTSTPREGGANLGHESALGAFVTLMFPLHMELSLKALRNDWITCWRPRRADPQRDRIGVFFPVEQSKYIRLSRAAGRAAGGRWSKDADSDEDTCCGCRKRQPARQAVTWNLEPQASCRERCVRQALRTCFVDGAVSSTQQEPTSAAEQQQQQQSKSPAASQAGQPLTPALDALPEQSAPALRGLCNRACRCCLATNSPTAVRLDGAGVAGLDKRPDAWTWIDPEEESRCMPHASALPCVCLRRCRPVLCACSVAQGAAQCGRSWRRGCSRTFWLPLDRIAAYYGETMAFYFAWLEFYTQWLIVPALAGMGLFAFQLYAGTVDIMAAPIFSLGTAVWSIVFLQAWKQRGDLLAQRWGVEHFAAEEVTRPQFSGQWLAKPDTGEIFRYYPRWRRRCKWGISLAVVALCVVVVCAGMLALFSTRDTVLRHISSGTGVLAGAELPGTNSSAQSSFHWSLSPEELGGNTQWVLDRMSSSTSALARKDFLWWVAMAGPPVAYGLIIPLLDAVFGRLAASLTNWENYRTESEYRNNRIAKIFSFRFVNCFVSLFYYAFMGGRGGSVLSLTVQLASFLIVGQLGSNVSSCCLPPLRRRWREWRFGRTLGRAEESGLTEGKRGRRLLRHATSQAWEQARLPEYDQFSDNRFASHMIQFGYVTLFSWAFPLAPLCALLHNLVEMRADGYQLTTHTRRPLAQKAAGIGVWWHVLHSMSVLAVITNCAHLALASTHFNAMFDALDITDSQRLLLVVLLEHCLISAQLPIARCMAPAKPAMVKVQAALQQEQPISHELWDDATQGNTQAGRPAKRRARQPRHQNH